MCVRGFCTSALLYISLMTGVVLFCGLCEFGKEFFAGDLGFVKGLMRRDLILQVAV